MTATTQNQIYVILRIETDINTLPACVLSVTAKPADDYILPTTFQREAYFKDTVGHPSTTHAYRRYLLVELTGLYNASFFQVSVTPHPP